MKSKPRLFSISATRFESTTSQGIKCQSSLTDDDYIIITRIQLPFASSCNWNLTSGNSANPLSTKFHKSIRKSLLSAAPDFLTPSISGNYYSKTILQSTRKWMRSYNVSYSELLTSKRGGLMITNKYKYTCMSSNSLTIGRAIAQAVSRWPLTAAARVRDLV
jgi:hypothetical protein